ncbi:MAG: rod shape-determining protein MreC [Bacteroidia bacterium]
MRNILKILQKYQHLVIFLFFQIVCFSLIIRQNDFHNSSFFNASNYVVGSVYEKIDDAKSYINLKEESALLSEENARLKTLLYGKDSLSKAKFLVKKDTLQNLHYKYISGKIINVFTKGENNYLTLNLGSKQDIEPHMGIVGPHGIVGFTKDVSKNFSTVVPIIHRKFTISVAHKKSNTTGLLQWQSNDNFSTATVINLPKYITINVGDTITTKGFDGIFNAGENVGYITEIFSKGGDDYNTAKINLLTDFRRISNVKVIKNFHQKEKLQLENSIEEEQ